MKAKQIRVPQSMYEHLKGLSTLRNTSVKAEAGIMFKEYNDMKQQFNKLKGKRVFVLK